MPQIDYSGITDAQLDTMIGNVVTHMNRILTGAQSGQIGNSRQFAMARIPELKTLLKELSIEKRLRGQTVDDMFILGQLGEPSGPFDGGI